MKSQGIQNLVQKIFSDEKTRQQFESNPNSILEQYKLTEQERKAVMKTYARLGLITSDSTQLEAVLEPTTEWWAPVP